MKEVSALENYTKTKPHERYEAEKRKKMAQACRKMEGLAKKLGMWNPQATIRKFRDTNLKDDSLVRMLAYVFEERLFMKRTTVFADDEVLRQLREMAKRENVTVSHLTRKALQEYVARRRPRRSRLSLVGIGRSGRKDVAARAEKILRKGFGR